ncbi:MAG: cupin domain-containing protein [Verrucomicrobiota bacterium]
MAQDQPVNSQVIIENVPFFADARGWVIEPIGEQQIPTQRNAHVALTEPGAIRGNHFHQHSTEVFVMMGPGLVRLREAGTVRDVNVLEGQAMRFTVPPGVSHAIKNTGTHPMLLMAFSTSPHDRANPDTHRDVLIAS